MKCLACQRRVKNWQGDDPKCAFAEGSFNADNWNCATVSYIRILSVSRTQHCANEEKFAAIDVTEVEGLGGAITLWVQWYKNRGRTQAMWLLYETDLPRAPTEEECLAIAKHYKVI